MVAGLLQRITAACAGQPDIAPMPVRNTCLGIDLPVMLLVLWSYHCLGISVYRMCLRACDAPVQVVLFCHRSVRCNMCELGFASLVTCIS